MLKVYLLDRGGEVREIYSTSWLHPALLLNDIRTLLREPAAKPVRQPGALKKSPASRRAFSGMLRREHADSTSKTGRSRRRLAYHSGHVELAPRTT